MEGVLISNNKYVYDKYPEDTIYYEEVTYMDILEKVRNKVHAGHKLLTHPLSGSVKPNETPYKTIMISKEKNGLCEDSLSIIEESIQTFRKFQNNKKTPDWNEKILDDFRTIDLSLIENVLE
ncbi:MAG TPA: GrdX family protein [Tissierellaceae bacterium]|nr:GrdX family protein [Tissierellaceae bacterium]